MIVLSKITQKTVTLLSLSDSYPQVFIQIILLWRRLSVNSMLMITH